MKKYLKLTFCILIFATSLIPLLATVIGVDSINLDKSSRAAMPKLIENNRINESFTLQFDDFFTDQFSYRTALITAYNEIISQLFSQSGNEKVIVGKDGFLFFEETLDDYLKINTLSEYDLMRLNEVLRIQQKHLERQGIDSYFMVVPNKATIYPQYMPSSIQPIGQASNLERIRNMDLPMSFIDLKEPLVKQSFDSQKLLYHRQDSHWNNVGAAIGYTAMMNALNTVPLPLLDQQPIKKIDWQGDLTRMLYPSRPTSDEQYYYPLPGQFTFLRAIRTLEDLQIESINSSKTNNLIMFRDSFANALIPYISESFAQVSYSRIFPYDYTKIEPNQAQTLVIQIAERNLNWLLQATPILDAIVVEESIPESSLISMKITFTQEKKSDLHFLNARFDDQILSEEIVAVRLVDNGTMVDAFPIYQDKDIEDDALQHGFSIYTKNALDLNAISIYVKMNDRWYKVSQP
jgi:hypothetical protein